MLRSMIPLRLLGVLALCLAGSVSSRAFACSVAPPPAQFNTDSTATTNGSTPAVPAAISAQLSRAQCQPRADCTDCGCLGSVSLKLALGDAQEWPGELGLRVRLVQGSLPTGIMIPDYPVVVRASGQVSWVGTDDAKQPLDLTLSVVAVDLAGHESQPTLVHLTDPGCSDDGGCSVASGPSRSLGSIAITLVALGLTMGMRRRMRR